MNEENTYECEFCDFEAANAAGLAAHERSHPSDERELEAGEVDQAVKEVEVESQESDDESTDDESTDEDCYRCGDSADLVHDVGRGLEVPLCEECDEVVSGNRYETKRTQIYFNG